MKTTTHKKALKLIKSIRKQLVWTKASGEEVQVSQMEVDHIQNTIVYLSKKQEDFKKYKVGTLVINELSASEWIEILRDELNYRLS